MLLRNLNDRPVHGGSREARLNPEISENKLNKPLGPKLPKPALVAADEEEEKPAVKVPSDAARRRAAGLPERFNKGR